MTIQTCWWSTCHHTIQVLQGSKVNGAMAPAAHTASWNRLETWETRGALEETGTRQARQSENTYSTRIWLWWLQLWIRLGTAFDLTADHRLGVSNHNHNDGPSNASFGCSRWAGLHLCPFLPVAVCLRLRQCHRDRPDRLTETAADCIAGRRRRSCWSNPPPQTTEKAKIPSLVVSNRRAGICRALSPLSSALLSRVHRWFSLPFSPPFNTPRFCASLPAEARRYRLGTIRVCASRDWSVATATRRRLGLDFRATGRGESVGQSTGFKSASAPRRPPRVLAGFARSTARACRNGAMQQQQQQGNAESHNASLQSCNLLLLLSVPRVRFLAKEHMWGVEEEGGLRRQAAWKWSTNATG